MTILAHNTKTSVVVETPKKRGQGGGGLSHIKIDYMYMYVKISILVNNLYLGFQLNQLLHCFCFGTFDDLFIMQKLTGVTILSYINL